MLEINQTAPPFSSPNQDNKIVSLADFNGDKHVVLYFYPKDDTPGCTIEANQFTELASEFAAHDTIVIGVSRMIVQATRPLLINMVCSLTCWRIHPVSCARPMVSGRKKKRTA